MNDAKRRDEREEFAPRKVEHAAKFPLPKIAPETDQDESDQKDSE